MRELASVWFSLGTLLVMPFWALMILAPRWRWTARIVGGPLIAAGPVALYAALVVPELATLLPAVAHPTLPDVARLLGTSRGATIAWAHFLALDLLGGRWIFLDARARGVPAWATSLVLVATLLVAPLGLVAYGVVLAARTEAVVGWVRRALGAHRPLAWLTWGSVGLLATALALQLVDGRQVLGASVWAKPAKFAASIAVSAPVLAWIIGHFEGDRARRARRAGSIMAGVVALELAIIALQAARGVPSHFNNGSLFDSLLFTVMGLGITIFWIAELTVAVGAFRHDFGSAARAWGIRLGLVGALFGGALGFIMPIPTAAQRARLAAGERPALVGAHAVGVPDGGPGLPVTRWSTVGGDLRAPHFLGLHALQALPLAAWLLERRRRESARRHVLAVGVAWLGLTLVALAQALRGQPLLAPDALTLGAALAALAAAAVVGLATPTGAPMPAGTRV